MRLGYFGACPEVCQFEQRVCWAFKVNNLGIGPECAFNCVYIGGIDEGCLNAEVPRFFVEEMVCGGVERLHSDDVSALGESGEECGADCAHAGCGCECCFAAL